MRRRTLQHAVRRGKLGLLEGHEDFLTASVFGLLPWLPLDTATAPLLRRACHYPTGLPFSLPTLSAVHVEFWPWWDEHDERSGAEPDVVLQLRTPAGVELLVVESKWNSGKSGHGEADQLARQYANGREIARRHGHRFRGIVYLTAHLAPPAEDLSASAAEIEQLTDVRRAELYWLSWRDLPQVLDGSACEIGTESFLGATARDTAEALRKWGLDRFGGFESPPARFDWQFRSDLALSVPSRVPAWTFRPSEKT